MKKNYYKSLVAAAIISSFTQTAFAETIGPLAPDQDTWTDGSSNKFGNNTLRIDDKNRAFVQFTIADIPAGHIIDTATLTLTLQSAKVDDVVGAILPDTFIAPVPGAIWDETTTDFSAVIAAIDEEIATATNIEIGIPVDFDVKDAITGNGTFTLLFDVSYDGARATKYHSMEAADETFRPKLIITTRATGPVDETAPVFDTDIPAIEVNATGEFTDISAAVAAAVTAQDETDAAPIPANVVGDASLTSGVQTVTVSASDAAGNTAETDVTVNITPLLTLSADKPIGVGTTTAVEVGLSGPAVTYPVTLNYVIEGAAVSDDGGSLTFDDSTTQTVDVIILADVEGGATGVLTLSSATNATLPEVASTTITAIAGNAAPTITLTLSQDGVDLGTITTDGANNTDRADVIHYIDATAGPVTVSADIVDINTEDSHDISWEGSSVDLGAQELAFSFEPTLLTGDFTLNVTATETENTDGKFLSSIPVITTIKVITTALPPLPTDETDTDGDGIFDKDEGYKDSDGDGIVDYLDHVDVEITQLPLADGQAPLQTEAGLSLSLGSVSTDALGVNADSAVISLANLSSAVGTDASDDGYFALEGASLINFTLTGVTDGEAASIVYPLADGVVLTDNTQYRKFTSENVWVEFENSGNNVIASTAKVDGACPAPNDESYDHGQGLRADDSCIQLTIEDNGIYDANATNGIIEDPGVLAEANAAPVWLANDINITFSVNENSQTKPKINITHHASDADGDALNFAKVSGPDWLTLEGGELFVNLAGIASGDYSATVSATDTKAQSAETTLNVSVSVNMPPVFTPVELPLAARNEDYSANISAQITDPEGDSYTFSKISGPYWLEVSETGELSGMPRNIDMGENIIELELVDDKGAKSTDTFTVEVVDNGERASDAGSFSATLFAILGLVSLRRRRQK